MTPSPRPTPLTDALILKLSPVWDFATLADHTRQLERDRAELIETLKQIVWIKDCGIDGRDEHGVFRNWPEQERDAMYKVAKALLARLEAK